MIIVEQEKVEIVLATYNGEKYLREQLESILNQSYSNIIITIWDDGSIDSTNEILQGYQTVFSDRIRIIENVGVSLGVI
ncbi:MAG: glycosyltransferase, partial [Anaerolineae bacterium]|nr:glycosyltransferase [Anaerolineae bacterium]